MKTKKTGCWRRASDVFKYVSDALKNDKDIVLETIRQDSSLFRDASKELQNDKEVVLTALAAIQDRSATAYSRSYYTFRSIFQHVSVGLRDDRDLVLEAIKRDGLLLDLVSEKLQNDKEVVLTAVKQAGHLFGCDSRHYNYPRSGMDKLRDVFRQFQDDKVFVLEAVKANPNVLEFVSKAHKNDKDIVLAAVSQDGLLLHHASEELRNDKDFIIKTVTHQGNSLSYASDIIKNNQDIVLAAVTQNGSSFKYASEELRNNKEFVLAAVKKNTEAFEAASEKIKKDKEFQLKLSIIRPAALKWALECKGDISIKLNDSVQKKDSVTRGLFKEIFFKFETNVISEASRLEKIGEKNLPAQNKITISQVKEILQKNLMEISDLMLPAVEKALLSDKEFLKHLDNTGILIGINDEKELLKMAGEYAKKKEVIAEYINFYVPKEKMAVSLDVRAVILAALKGIQKKELIKKSPEKIMEKEEKNMKHVGQLGFFSPKIQDQYKQSSEEKTENVDKKKNLEL